jgi:hypothetical protein
MRPGSRPNMSYKEVYEKAKAFTGKDKELDKRVMSMANQTWDMIGGDILQSIEEYGDKPEMPRSHVIEVVRDADYMLMHGGDPEAYAYYLYLRDNHEKHLDKVMKEAFTFKRYGF